MADEHGTAGAEEPADAYAEYIARKHDREALTDEITAAIKEKVAEIAPGLVRQAGATEHADSVAARLDPAGFDYSPAWGRTKSDQRGGTYIYYPEGTIRVEGPKLANGERYVAKVWMVPHRTDPANGDGGLWWMLIYPVVGWAIVILWNLFRLLRVAAGRPLNPYRTWLAEAVNDPSRPWAWTLTREGPIPWPVVAVQWEFAHLAGLRNPEPDPQRHGWFMVEQMEESKETALAAARNAVDRFGY